MIAIIDYGVGNLFSLGCSFEYIGEKTVITSDEKTIRDADRLVLPGVGAFGDAADKLKDKGLREAVITEAKSGKPLLGICLGMQLLFTRGLEFGEHGGLNLIDGSVVSIKPIAKNLKIPHIGWNSLDFDDNNKSPLFKYIRSGEYVYFVHSYHAETDEKNIIATSFYGGKLTAAVQKNNIFGTQFHPEKSGKTGLNILRAFCEYGGEKC
jgi:glutamine amidotransferase